MDLPKFLSLEGDSLIFNQDNATFVYYIPEEYFNNDSKVSIAEEYGQYISFIGICDWAIIDGNGKVSTLKAFCFPTMVMCKPDRVEKVKNYRLADGEPADYRLLKFNKGDEVISQIRVPQLIDNVEIFFKMFVITSKFPTTIAYDEIWQVFVENAALNGFSYGLSNQLFGVLIGGLCRAPEDTKKPFRFTNMDNMNKYKLISIKMLPKYISPYTALISEGWDQDIQAAILMKDTPEDELANSPLEKIVMM